MNMKPPRLARQRRKPAMGDYDPFANAPTDTSGSGPPIQLPPDVANQYYQTYGTLPAFSSLGTFSGANWADIGKSLLNSFTSIFVARENAAAARAGSIPVSPTGQAVAQNSGLILGVLGVSAAAAIGVALANKRKRR